MAYYEKSVFYPIIGLSHEKIFRYAQKCIRQPITVVSGTVAQFSWDQIQKDASISLLDDREHVLTLDLYGNTAQFSQNYEELAFECAQNGWLEVKR